MGSLEEDQLVQMVQDFMESESPSPTDSNSSKCAALSHQTQLLILQVGTSQITIRVFAELVFTSL